MNGNIKELEEIGNSYPFAYLTLCELGNMEYILEYIKQADDNQLYYGHYLNGKALIEKNKIAEG
jgi:hypothetical protein